MKEGFQEVFAKLKPLLLGFEKRLAVKTDTRTEYTLVTKAPSPFPQHKGHPMYFGSVQLGRAYVSFHLMPLYMNKKLTKTISPGLKKRMQGKTCFNFKSEPETEVLEELKRLTRAGVEAFAQRKWL
jgi:hypothetical protein